MVTTNYEDNDDDDDDDDDHNHNRALKINAH
jgi:hypothetical protein